MTEFAVPNINERQRIPMEAIDALAGRIIEKFSPDKVILFGSYAYGEPKPWSDVDLLVIMAAPEGNLQKMLALSRALSPHPFGIDILVRTPAEFTERLAAGDLFLTEIASRGKILYEKRSLGMGQQS